MKGRTFQNPAVMEAAKGRNLQKMRHQPSKIRSRAVELAMMLFMAALLCLVAAFL
ncbi:MAG TPA: hypothetical protein VH913_23400 [Hyphomicrobiaceae bacterium]